MNQPLDSYRRLRKAGQENAVDARFEAQKIAFAPLSFQAAKALRDFGVLEELLQSGKNGLSIKELSSKLSLSDYCLKTLLEVGFSLGMVKLSKDERYSLDKVGSFILHDEMTKVNMDFVNDVCYQGAYFLQESFLKGEPVGLKVLGDWAVIYDGLSELSPVAKKSWFDFDHYYSDIAFSEALPIIFKHNPKNICDIGGNTGKWTIECLKYDSNVKLTIVDLPGQLNSAKQNLQKLNLDSRVSFHPLNILDENPSISSELQLPQGADIVWMSQFLDCFSPEQIVAILKKVARAISDTASVYILEPFWDKQKYKAASFSLNHTSLYFTCMANGKSKMYSFNEMLDCINEAGLKLREVHDEIGEHDYTLLRCSK